MINKTVIKLILITLTLLNLQACFSEAPPINFQADKITINKGEEVVLYWLTDDATSVTITDYNGVIFEGNKGDNEKKDHDGNENINVLEVSAYGSIKVKPLETSTYTLVAVNEIGATTSEIVINVHQERPTIEISADKYFIEKGNEVRLSWNIINADKIKISPKIGKVEASGEVIITPKKTTTYKIQAKGLGGKTIQYVTINVVKSLTDGMNFYATPSLIDSGESAQLKWNVPEKSKKLKINNGVGKIQALGEVTVNPKRSSIYRLQGKLNRKRFSLQTAVNVTPEPLPKLFLSISKSSIRKGEVVTISWTSLNGKSLRANKGIGKLPMEGSIEISPEESKLYSFRIKGKHRVRQRYYVLISVVDIFDPEPLVDFNLSSDSIILGQVATLKWDTNYAYEVSISPDFGPVEWSGTTNLSPLETTTYTITATGLGGTVTKQVTLIVYYPPEATLSSDVATIIIGQSANLSWTSQYADISLDLQPGIGAVDAIGTVSVSPTETTTYTLTGVGNGGSISKEVTIIVYQLPEATLSSDLASIIIGQSANLSWTSQFADISLDLQPGIGAVDANGSVSVSPTETTIYTLTGVGNGGTISKTVTVIVYQLPEASLSSAAASIIIGQSANLTWISQFVDISLDLQPGIGAVAPNGTLSVSPTVTTTYTLTGVGNGGTITKEITVVVYQLPEATLSSDVANIIIGQSANLSWTSQFADISLTLKQGIGAVNANGTVSVSPAETTTYTLTGVGNGGTISKTVTVVVYQLPEATLTSDVTSIIIGQSANLSWTSQFADISLDVQPGIGAVDPNSTFSVSPTETTTYTLTGVGHGGTITKEITVVVYQLPEATLSSDVATIIIGQSANLSWTSQYADISLDLQPGIGAVDANGIISVTPTETTTYTLTGVGNGGSISKEVTIIVYQLPEATLSSDVASIIIGQSANLSWTSQFADISLTLQPGIGAVNANGTVAVSPTETTTYTLTGVGNGGTISKTVTVVVYQLPEATLTSDVASIIIGQSANLKWTSQFADISLTLQPGIGAVEAIGTVSVSPTETTTYTLTGVGNGGSINKAVTVIVYQLPQASLTSDVTTIAIGESAIITWTSSNANISLDLQPGIGGVSDNGNIIVSPVVTTTYTLTGVGDGGSISQNLTIIVLTNPPELTFTVSSSTIQLGESATLSWSSLYSDDVTITPDIGISAVSGSAVVSPISATTYTATATGPAGSVSKSVSVDVVTNEVTAPILSLDNNPTETNLSQISITGIATDSSGISRVYYVNDAFGAQEFAAIVNSDGSFTAEAPLVEGLNVLTFYAEDIYKNRSGVSVSITRNAIANTSLTISQPLNSSTSFAAIISVNGEVTATFNTSQMSISLNGKSGNIITTSTNNVYNYNFTNVSLNEGTNTFVVELITPNETLQRTVSVTHQVDNSVDIPPAIENISPLSGSYLKTKLFIINGNVKASKKPATLTINSDPVTIQWLNATDGFFVYTPQIDSLATSYQAVMIFTDSENRVSSETTNYIFDTDSPLITLEKSLQAYPTINEITENPYLFKGQVEDTNLSSVFINGSVLELTQLNASTYEFSVSLNMPKGVETLVSLTAVDLSGNLTELQYTILNQSSGLLEILQPLPDSQLLFSDTTFNLQVTARAAGLTVGDFVEVTFDQELPEVLPVENDFVNTQIVVPAVAGTHALSFVIKDTSGSILNQDSVNFEFISQATVPLEVEKTIPTSAANYVEPNLPISVFFNKAIDINKLTFSVKETLFGKTYAVETVKGEEALFKNTDQLIEVNRQNEQVLGALSLLPGNQIVTFYPERFIGYNAHVFVDIAYEGIDIIRFDYQVRELPTFLQGFIVDQLNQPISNLEVSLPELARTTTTDNDGGFDFGYGDSAKEALPAGRYQLVINPKALNQNFSSRSFQTSIQKGIVNKRGITTLSVINPEVAFNRIQGGGEVVLAQGDLTLDMTNVSLTFPDGKPVGLAHTQFQDWSAINREIMPVALPHWLFEIQPEGIKVTGDVSLSIAMPTLNGSYEYVPKIPYYVVMLGVNDNTNLISPIGVGLIENNVVTTVGKLNMKHLDFIGYAFVAHEAQDLLKQVVEGELTVDELIAGLSQ